ncbi:DUF3093 domain-containing protein [Phytomonospora sp. NPDC050363]|uniref:DUF3093 domain-containing protein n=1 Tax=Phytomonospora sp. NPDC050363 TaxID=3155642 RepID=UPI0033C5E7C3
MTDGSFRERMYVPWWAWPVTLAIVALLAAEIHMGAPGVRVWLPYAVGLPAATALLLWLGRLRVSVVGGRLEVDDANLPVEFIGEVTPLEGTALRDALSVGLHPLAFVVQRPWVRGAVRVEVNDADDPTPYWIVSTRRPERLAEALRSAQGAPRPVDDAHPVS